MKARGSLSAIEYTAYSMKYKGYLAIAFWLAASAYSVQYKAYSIKYKSYLSSAAPKSLSAAATASAAGALLSDAALVGPMGTAVAPPTGRRQRRSHAARCAARRDPTPAAQGRPRPTPALPAARNERQAWACALPGLALSLPAAHHLHTAAWSQRLLQMIQPVDAMNRQQLDLLNV